MITFTGASIASTMFSTDKGLILYVFIASGISGPLVVILITMIYRNKNCQNQDKAKLEYQKNEIQ